MLDGEEGSGQEPVQDPAGTPPLSFPGMPGTAAALEGILGNIPSLSRAPPGPAAAAGHEPSAAWDLRHGALPNGLEVVGGDAEFVSQQDGSMALRLQPMSYLKVSAVQSV